MVWYLAVAIALSVGNLGIYLYLRGSRRVIANEKEGRVFVTITYDGSKEISGWVLRNQINFLKRSDAVVPSNLVEVRNEKTVLVSASKIVKLVIHESLICIIWKSR